MDSLTQTAKKSRHHTSPSVQLEVESQHTGGNQTPVMSNGANQDLDEVGYQGETDLDDEVSSPNADIDEANQSSAQKGGGDVIEVSTTSSGTRSTRHESLPNTLLGFLPFANRPNPSPKPLTSGDAPFIVPSVNIFSQSQDMAPSSSVPIVNTLLEDHDGLTCDHPMSPLFDACTSVFGSSDGCQSSPQTSGVLANLNELASHANLPPFLPQIVHDPSASNVTASAPTVTASAPNVTVVRQDKTTIEDELDFLASLGSQFSTPPPSTLSVSQTIQDALIRAKDFLSLPLDDLLSSLETGWPSDAFELLSRPNVQLPLSGQNNKLTQTLQGASSKIKTWLGVLKQNQELQGIMSTQIQERDMVHQAIQTKISTDTNLSEEIKILNEKEADCQHKIEDLETKLLHLRKEMTEIQSHKKIKTDHFTCVMAEVHTAHDKTKSLISTDEIAFKKEFIIQARADSMSKLAGLKAIVEDLLSTIGH
ncbi:hypothetical protein LINGRAHAP2_LOCUS7274 [Linum grandiflorum]